MQCNDICRFVSPCVGGSKAPPHTLYRIKCVLAEVYTDRKLLQKIYFLTSCSNSLHKCKTSDGLPQRHRLHKSCLIQYVYDIKRSPLGRCAPSGLTLYIVYVPSRHDLSNTYVIHRRGCTYNSQLRTFTLHKCSLLILAKLATKFEGASNTLRTC